MKSRKCNLVRMKLTTESSAALGVMSTTDPN